MNGPVHELKRLYAVVGVDRRVIERHGRPAVESKCRDRALELFDIQAEEKALNLIMTNFITTCVDDLDCPQVIFKFSMGAISGN